MKSTNFYIGILGGVQVKISKVSNLVVVWSRC